MSKNFKQTKIYQNSRVFWSHLVELLLRFFQMALKEWNPSLREWNLRQEVSQTKEELELVSGRNQDNARTLDNPRSKANPQSQAHPRSLTMESFIEDQKLKLEKRSLDYAKIDLLHRLLVQQQLQELEQRRRIRLLLARRRLEFF